MIYPTEHFKCTWNVYSAALGWNVPRISFKSNWSFRSFKASIVLLIFCLEHLSIHVTGVLKSLIIKILLSISPFMYVSTYLLCCCSVAHLCLTLCDSMDCSTPWFPFLDHLLELAQTHVHWVGDAIQSSCLLLSPSPAFNLSQHQDLFKWVSSSYQVARVLQLQLQHQFFQWIFRTDFLLGWLVWSLCNSRDSQEYSPAPQLESINSLALSNFYGPTLTSMHDSWKNHSFDYMDFCWQSDVSAF